MAGGDSRHVVFEAVAQALWAGWLVSGPSEPPVSVLPIPAPLSLEAHRMLHWYSQTWEMLAPGILAALRRRFPAVQRPAATPAFPVSSLQRPKESAVGGVLSTLAQATVRQSSPREICSELCFTQIQ